MALNIQKKIKNCTQCGKIFSPMRGENLCRDCTIKQEEKEKEVLDYVRDNQGCSISEVVSAMGVTEKFIKNMLKKGLFANVQRTDFFYPCAACGKPIKNGTYCSDCLSRLRNETKKMADQMAVKMGLKQNAEKPAKKLSELSTLEKLDLQAKRELEIENQKKSRRSMYEAIVSKRDGRVVGKPHHKTNE